MTDARTPAGRWLIDHSQWDEGQRAFRVRINATAGPDDMARHVRTIEDEAQVADLRRVQVYDGEGECVLDIGLAPADADQLVDFLRGVQDGDVYNDPMPTLRKALRTKP